MLNTIKLVFIDFLDYVKDEAMYKDDYVFGDIQKSNFHMIVISIPEKFHKAFEHWKVGEYSKMYSEETIALLFNAHPKTKKVLVKDHNYKIYFTEKVNNMVGFNKNVFSNHRRRRCNPMYSIDKLKHIYNFLDLIAKNLSIDHLKSVH